MSFQSKPLSDAHTVSLNRQPATGMQSSRPSVLSTSCFAFLLLAGAVAFQSRAALGELISRRSEPAFSQANSADVQPNTHRSGRWLAFTSPAPRLEGDRNGTAPDVFLRDLQSGSVTRISHRLGGPESGNAGSHSAQITPDGQSVVFVSDASDLIADDVNGETDVFVWSRTTNEIRLVSRTPGGKPGNAGSDRAILSGNARYILFESMATDLVANDANERRDLFRHDLATGTTECVSVAVTMDPPVPAGGYGGD